MFQPVNHLACARQIRDKAPAQTVGANVTYRALLRGLPRMYHPYLKRLGSTSPRAPREP